MLHRKASQRLLASSSRASFLSHALHNHNHNQHPLTPSPSPSSITCPPKQQQQHLNYHQTIATLFPASTITTTTTKNQSTKHHASSSSSSTKTSAAAGVNLEQVEQVVFRGHEATHPLDHFFKPKSIVVIGASEHQNSNGRIILWNLMSCRLVKVYPIHATKSSVMGLSAYPSVESIVDSLVHQSSSSSASSSSSSSTFMRKNKGSAVSTTTTMTPLIDLAIICTPVDQLISALSDCIRAGVKAAVLVSPSQHQPTAASSELNSQQDTDRIYEQALQMAKQVGMRLMGPDCLGVMTPGVGSDGRTVFMNATFTGSAAIPGRIAVISQTSEMGVTVLDWGLKKNVGFSAFMSIGSNMLDISWGDLIEYYGRDENTDAILLYMESIGSIENARQFISAARNVALKKPIILIKSGRRATELPAQQHDSLIKEQEQSRTESLMDSDKVLDTIFERCGVLRVDTIEDLFNMAQVLSKQPRPKGNRIALISNSTSASNIAVDSLYDKGELAQLSESTKLELQSKLPNMIQMNNPLNILPDAKPERYIEAMDILSKDPNVDAILAILTPQELTEPTRTAQLIKRRFAVSSVNKTLVDQPVILTCWMGGLETEVGRDMLVDSGIPSFIFPDTVLQVYKYMWKYSKNIENLYEVTSKAIEKQQTSLPQLTEENVQQAKSILQNIMDSGRRILNEHESKAILELYGIPTAKSIVCNSIEEALAAAQNIGYPVAMKVHSDTITYKLEIDGVKLNLQDDEAIKRCFNKITNSIEKFGKTSEYKGVTVQPMIKQLGYHSTFELILGSTYNNQFGPMLLFGSGGSYVSVNEDVALAVPPLTNTLAKKMIKKTRISRVLEGYRMKAGVDMELLQQVITRFSRLVIDLSAYVKNIDINPIKISSAALLGTEDLKLIALDARMILHPEGVKKITPVIRLYPTEYVTKVTLRNGDHAVVRPLRFDDHPRLVNFFGSLSKAQFELSSKEEALSYENAFYNLKKQQEKAQINHQHQSDEKPEMLQLNNSVGKLIYNELVQMCIGDYDRELVLGALVEDSIVAIGRYTVSPRSTANYKIAEIAVLVGESYQKHGVGRCVLSEMVNVAKKEAVKELVAHIHTSNVGMQKLTTKLGFKIQKETAAKPGFVTATLVL